MIKTYKQLDELKIIGCRPISRFMILVWNVGYLETPWWPINHLFSVIKLHINSGYVQLIYEAKSDPALYAATSRENILPTARA